MNAVFVYPEELDRIKYPSHHPIKISRTKTVFELCKQNGFFKDLSKETFMSRRATFKELERYHDTDFLEAIKKSENSDDYYAMVSYGLGSSDCPVFKGLYDYCEIVAGSTIAGARLLRNKKAMRVFNPAGGFHHAQKAYAEGFCYVNDIVLGILELLDAGFKRIAYVDLDAHHGNGVQNAFYDDKRVLTVSIHESGYFLYPGSGFEDETGEGDAKGFNINIPLSPATGDDEWLTAFKKIVPPLLAAFKPQAIVTQFGADGLAEDPLTHLRLTSDGLCAAIKLLKGFDLPWLVVGGGGYNVDATVKTWALGWAIINDMDGL